MIIDWEKENFGIIDKSEVNNKGKNYTIMQLLNPKLKNELGESNIEVRKRMKEAILSIIQDNLGKRIAVISHGAAIKFFLQEFCKYDENEDCLKYNGEFVCPRQLSSPSMIELVLDVDDINLFKIKNIKYKD